MIEEQATVVSVETDYFVVSTQRQSSCQSCSAKKGCGTGVLAKTMGQKHNLVTIRKRSDDTPSLNSGDQVIIGIDENSLLAGSMLAYILPLGLMLIFGLLAELAFQSAHGSGEGLVIALAIIGLITGLLLSRFYISQSGRSSRFEPVLVRKIQQLKPVRDNILLP